MIRLSARVVIFVVSICGFMGGCHTSNESEETRAERRAGSGDNAERRRVGEERIGDLREESDSRVALAFPTGNRASSAILLERLSPPEVRLGEPYEYQIKVTNLTSATLSDVVVREKVPADLEVTGNEPTPKVENGEAAFALGDLPPRQSKMIRVSGTPKKAGNLDSCVTVSYTPTLCTSTAVINPMLKIVKDVAKDADACEPLVFRYTVSNVGSGTERNVRIEEKLPEGLSTEDGRDVIAVDVGDLAEGKSKEVTARVKPAKAGTYKSVATAHGGGKEIVSEPIEVVVRQPKLEVSVSGLRLEYINKRSTYQVTVKNAGDAPARRTMVRLDTGGRAEPLMSSTPEERAGASFDADSARPAGTISRSRARGGELVREVGTLAAGESKTVDFDVRIVREGEMRVLASASAECAPAVETSIVTNVGTLPALRLEVVDVEDAIKVGENIVYRITVKNQGSGDDEDIRVVATLPPEETFVRASGSSDATVDGQVITFAPVTRLEPEKTAEWRVEAKAARAGDVRFEVRMTSKSLSKPAVETEPTRLY